MKKILLLAISIVIFNCAKAQTYDTTTYYGKMAYTFNNLDKTPITTGLLRDYGIDFTSPDDFTGKTLNDSNWVTLPDFRALYATLYSQQIKSPAAMQGLDSINRLMGRFALSNLPVTFACLYYNFNVLDTNAAINHLVTVSAGGQLNDVAGRSQSPYLLHSAFAIAPMQQNIAVGSNQFILRPELFIGNTGKAISSLQIDTKGSGTYQTVSFNVPFTASYDTAGIYTVNFKITYTDGSINFSHTKLAAHGNSTLLNRFGTYYYSPVDFTADKMYLGIAAKGDYTIDYSIHNTTGTIQKPLIVISGFDPEAVDDDDSQGLTYYDDYVDRINYDYNTNPLQTIPLNGTQGLDDADSYDMIYLHWHNGTDYIQRNAYLLEKLIAYVNANKTTFNGVRQQNVIIGTSMGGLVARYALRDMEINSVPHDTRLFISHDAPNWGANVPPAYQALVQYLAPWQIISNVGFSFPIITLSYKDMFPEAKDGVALFNSPAAKQMIIQRYTLSGNTLTADNSTHTSFMTEINNMGWPLNCRNVVLANGACNGTVIFPDNNKMLEITGKQGWTYAGGLWRSLAASIGGIPGIAEVIVPNVPARNLSLLVQYPLSLISTKQNLNFDFGAWAVPTSGTSLIFKGNVYIHRMLLWGLASTTSYILKCNVNSTTDMLPLDNAPGGKYDIAEFGISEDEINDQLAASHLSWVHASLLQNQFCFVPTVSSLALNNPQQNLKVSLCNNIPCLLPAHVTDFYAPTVNQIHVSYTNDNSNWILQEQDAGYNCTVICPTSLSIFGPLQFCTSGTYSIPNLPSGASVVWSASPSSSVSIGSPTLLTTTLTKISDGTIILKATITNSCSNFAINSKSIRVGAYPLSSYSIAGATTVYASAGYHYAVTFPLGAFPNNIFWRVPTGWTILDGQGTTNVHIWTGSAGGQVQCDFDNSCGEATGIFITAVIGSGGPDPELVGPETSKMSGTSLLTATPNPASSRVIVSLTQSQSSVASVKNINAIKQIKIIDKMGVVKKQFNFNNNNTSQSINVSGMQPDTYFIQAYNGSEWLSCKLIIIN